MPQPIFHYSITGRS